METDQQDKPQKTLKIMFECVTRETGYPKVIENTNIFIYKSNFINRQHTFNVLKKLNSFKNNMLPELIHVFCKIISKMKIKLQLN